MTDCFKDIGSVRLLELADVLDTADERHHAKGEPKYLQAMYRHKCGTPACAMGHYAANFSERIKWASTVLPRYIEYIRAREVSFNLDVPAFKILGGEWVSGTSAAVHEFCLTPEEGVELFGGTGCGGARSARAAAKYIRTFVFRKLSCQ